MLKKLNLFRLIIAHAKKSANRNYTPKGVVVVVVKKHSNQIITSHILILYFLKINNTSEQYCEKETNCSTDYKQVPHRV